jgi:hypothetical protein
MDRVGSGPREDGAATVTTENPQWRKMDISRLKGAAGARIVYRHGGRATALRIYAFTEAKTGQVLEVAWSADGHDFAKLATSEDSFLVPGSNPNDLRPVRITAATIPPAARQLAITWVIPAEIGRVELDWVPTEP